ncbi:unnamed protein product, partial [Meganyctiphanes norvegica]
FQIYNASIFDTGLYICQYQDNSNAYDQSKVYVHGQSIVWPSIIIGIVVVISIVSLMAFFIYEHWNSKAIVVDDTELNNIPNQGRSRRTGSIHIYQNTLDGTMMFGTLEETGSIHTYENTLDGTMIVGNIQRRHSENRIENNTDDGSMNPTIDAGYLIF